MFILGILAFLQTVFLPGFIAIKYLGIHRGANALKEIDGKIRQLVYTFGLSLLINYLLVFALTALGIYKPLTLYIILFGEGILLIYYRLTSGKPSDCCTFNLDINRWLTSLKQFFASHSLGYNLLFLVSVAVISWYVFLFFYFFGGVFEHWDPVVGWNRFALDWAANRLPANTWHYPQLVPANWSISYVMMQNIAVQCFAKAIMPLFSIAVLLLFLDLGLRRKKAVYLLGLIFYGVLLAYLHDPSYIVSGYVDIAVSFFAFLSFYTLIGLRHENGTRPFSAIWLAVLFASTAAITKQAGLFILFITLLWVLNKKFLRGIQGVNTVELSSNKKFCGGPGGGFSKEPPGRRRQILKPFLLLLTVGIIVVPWYLFKELQIGSGKDRSEIHMVQQAHQTTDYTERFARGFDRLLTHRHPKLKFPVLAGLLLMLLGLFHKQSWGVTLFIVIPYTLAWGFFFSYDFRNLTLAVPFMGFSAAFGTDFLKKRLLDTKKFPQFKIPKIPLIIFVFLLLVVMNYTVFKEATLIRRQTRQKMKIGDAGLNDLLYQYHAKKGFTGKIATNYQYLGYLPHLEQFYYYYPGRVKVRFLDYLETAEGKQIHYLLVPFILEREKETYQRFREKIKNQEYHLIFKWRGYWFIKVNEQHDASGGHTAFD